MQKYEKLNGQTISFGQLMKLVTDIIENDLEGKVYIPMYQRNYKWHRNTGNSNAEKLVKDLIYNFKHVKEKSLALFTLHVKENRIQIVDGQQRIITLMLIFYAIGHKDDFIPLEFERDFELDDKNKRITFLNKLISKQDIHSVAQEIISQEVVALTDKRRLIYNFLGIKERLNDKKEGLSSDEYIDFIEYIKNSVKLLLHITSDEPVSEFLNMNSKKIKFRICDIIRAKLIIYMSLNSDFIKISDTLGLQLDTLYKKKISELFEEISNLFYNDEIYKTVKLSYVNPDNTKDNRLNILFASKYYGLRNSKSHKEINYSDFEEEALVGKEKIIIQRMVFYKKMLDEINRDINKSYYLTIRAFEELNHLESIRFFDLLDEFIEESVSQYKESQEEEELLAKIIHSKFSIDRLIFDRVRRQNDSENDVSAFDTYKINRYFDAMSCNIARPLDSKGNLIFFDSDFKIFFEKQNQYGNKEKFFPVKKKDLTDIIQGSGKYMLYKYIDAHEEEVEKDKNEIIEL